MYFVNFNNHSSIESQLENHFINLIKQKVLKANYKLPSCRILASDLNINRNTVNEVYKSLEKKGYVYTLYKKGVYVSDIVSNEETLSDKDIYNMIVYLKQNNVKKEDVMVFVNEVYK